MTDIIRVARPIAADYIIWNKPVPPGTPTEPEALHTGPFKIYRIKTDPRVKSAKDRPALPCEYVGKTSRTLQTRHQEHRNRRPDLFNGSTIRLANPTMTGLHEDEAAWWEQHFIRLIPAAKSLNGIYNPYPRTSARQETRRNPQLAAF